MRQAIQIRCWKCQEVFTMSADMPANPSGSTLVDLLVACPFCSTDNRVKVEEHLLKTVTVHRGDSSGTAVDLSQRGALLNYVFNGQEPTTS